MGCRIFITEMLRGFEKRFPIPCILPRSFYLCTDLPENRSGGRTNRLAFLSEQTIA